MYLSIRMILSCNQSARNECEMSLFIRRFHEFVFDDKHF